MARRHEAVVVGAGIAGAAAAYFLSVEHGLRDVCIVEQGDPLALTSDKSSECYRNWWPGPGNAMVHFTNRSIDLLERFSERSGERFNMNRRGYVFATATASGLAALRNQAAASCALGAGPLREHHGAASDPDYLPHRADGWRGMPEGADLFLDPALIRRHFPALSAECLGLLHVRRCGWLRAQQLGAWFLEQARAHGARIVRARARAFTQVNGAITGVRIEGQGGTELLATPRLVLSPGPHLNQCLDALGIELPVCCEGHVKVILHDSAGAVPGDAPMLIWQDAVDLPWSEDERAALADDPQAHYLLRRFPPGVHGRPEGSPGQQHLLMLWTYDIAAHREPRFPLAWDPHLPEIIVRGMSRMLPGMRAYLRALPRMPVDGGYYTKTPDNRPLVGPLPVAGAYLNAAYSGFGIMAACAGGELLAAHVMGTALPEHAAALAPARFDDPHYLDAFADSGDAGQL